ncbi:MAG TPA: TIGR01777 family oxidoreductase [Vicinamibacterales bacterium]
MKIVIAGGSGFLGSALIEALRARGDEIVVLSRRVAQARPVAQAFRPAVAWTPDGTTGPWAREIDGAGAVINLAGEPMPDKRWTAAQKERILQSRVLATRSLVAAARAASQPPPAFISGSGVDFYPDSDEIVDETSPAGTGFLSRVCLAWEAEAREAERSGCRVVLLRTGVVLHRDGGALPKLLTPFRFGAGGPLGSGRQWWPWIHRDDWVRMTLWAVDTAAVRGPLNVCAPEPARYREIANAIGRALRRPSFMPAPAFALRILLGEMAEMLLTSKRAVPARARELGFTWRFPELDAAVSDAVTPRTARR